MRDIRFRAWDKEKAKMLRPFGFTVNRLTLASLAQDDLRDYELMQFIGLLDKNGKEIYEGDIVKILEGHMGPYPEDYKVVWSDKMCGFVFENGKAEVQMKLSFTDRYEVIGDIYQNSELLK